MAVRRRGQTTVETLLLVSVIVIGAVSIGYFLVGDNSGIKAGLESMADGAKNAYVDPNRAP